MKNAAFVLSFLQLKLSNLMEKQATAVGMQNAATTVVPRGVKNYNRQQRRRQQGQDEQHLATASALGQVVTLEIPAPAAPAAIAHFYRQTKDSPLHALGAER